MSAVPDDAAATSRLLSEVDATMLLFASDAQAMPSFCYYLTFILAAEFYLIKALNLPVLWMFIATEQGQVSSLLSVLYVDDGYDPVSDACQKKVTGKNISLKCKYAPCILSIPSAG